MPAWAAVRWRIAALLHTTPSTAPSVPSTHLPEVGDSETPRSASDTSPGGERSAATCCCGQEAMLADEGIHEPPQEAAALPCSAVSDPLTATANDVSRSESDNAATGICEEKPSEALLNALDQLTVNEYKSGVGLSKHIDTHSAFTGRVLCNLCLPLSIPCLPSPPSLSICSIHPPSVPLPP
jgi:hypothetical protein